MAQEPKRRLLAGCPRTKHLLIGIIAIIAITSLLLTWYRKSPARANWALSEVGLAQLPTSRYNCRIVTHVRRNKSLSGLNNYDTYIMFRSDPNTITEYIRESSGLKDGPTEIFEDGGSLIQGPSDWPRWYKPEAITRGRYYYVFESRVSVAMVYIDDGSNNVYISVHLLKFNWLGRIRGIFR